MGDSLWTHSWSYSKGWWWNWNEIRVWTCHIGVIGTIHVNCEGGGVVMVTCWEIRVLIKQLIKLILQLPILLLFKEWHTKLWYRTQLNRNLIQLLKRVPSEMFLNWSSKDRGNIPSVIFNTRNNLFRPISVITKIAMVIEEVLVVTLEWVKVDEERLLWTRSWKLTKGVNDLA